MSKRLNLIGKTFGYLTVKSFAGIKRQRTYWFCNCDCNFKGCKKTIEVCGVHLTTGKVTSCKARRKNCGRDSFSWKGYEDMPGQYLSIIKSTSRKRELQVLITTKDLWNQFKKQNGCCAFDGQPLTLFLTGRKVGTASVDRIDSSKGYTPDNIQWIHKDYQSMKMDYNEDEFFAMIKRIYEYKFNAGSNTKKNEIDKSKVYDIVVVGEKDTVCTNC